MREEQGRPTARRRSRLLTTGLACVAVLSVAVVTDARADGVQDQQHAVEQIAARLDDIANRIGRLDEDYGAAQDEQASLDVQLTALQTKIDAQSAQLAGLDATMAKIAIDKYTSSSTGALSPVLSDAGAYSDAQQRDTLDRLSLENGAGDVDQARALSTSLAKNRSELQRQRQHAGALTATLAAKQAEASRLQDTYESEYTAAKAKYGELVQQEQDRQAAAAVAKAADVARQQDAPARGGGAPATAAKTPTPTSTAKATPAPAPTPISQPRSSAAPARSPSTTAPGVEPPADTTAAPVDTGGSDGSAPPNDAAPSPATGSNDAQTNEPPPPSSRASIAIAAALSQLGVAYQFAAESPGVAFDCSGLTKWAWAQAGVSLPHQSALQYGVTPHVSQADIQPGDLVYYHTPIGHVAIYLGNGQIVEAPRPGDVVHIVAVRWANVVGISRPG
jgi:cell wall-associated NlpC family hydrolase